MIRYTKLPIELFRVQRGVKVALREYERQIAKKSRSFDFKLQPDGLIHPETGDQFRTPNGMSLRPGGPVFGEILSMFAKTYKVIRLPPGLELPDKLVLIHEHSDHYSVQTTEPCSEQELNNRMTEWLKNGGEFMSINDYYKLYPLINE